MASGRVLVSGAPANKPSRLVSPADALVVLFDGPRFVSRGGDNLDRALESLAVSVLGRRALDVGSSTGGFVDCLLRRGATQVLAVDVGRGQLDPRLRSDPRVVVHEGCNIRSVGSTVLGADGPVDIVTADLSFISLRTVATSLIGLLRPGGDLVALVKPQFEVGRIEASRTKGIIRDPELWREAMLGVASALTDAGTGIMGAVVSELPGSAGNREFFLHAVPGAPPTPGEDIAAMVQRSVESATADH